MRRIVLLGATGSIGRQTLEVLRGHPESFSLVGVAARKDATGIAAIAQEFGVKDVGLWEESAARQAASLVPPGTRVHVGSSGLEALASLPEADLVLVAVVGTLGLGPALAALRSGKDLGLASKEILVLAGSCVMAEATRHGRRILPVDSEHNAIFQCLEGHAREGVRKLWLTASGGAFRDAPVETLSAVTPAMATRHPNWSMGPKITVDSATMANKGLELIEARWLFGVAPSQVDVVIHPQSIVHSLVEFVDGAILAQLSPPSMTFAIQHVLFHPMRRPPVVPTLDLRTAMTLDFRPPDPARYPALGLARAALESGDPAPAIFNASNEVAVASFLEGRLPYLGIPAVIEETLAAMRVSQEPGDLAAILAVDAEARRVAAASVARLVR